VKTIKVNLKQRSYKIIIANNALEKTGKLIKDLKVGTDAYIITNPTINRLYGNSLQKTLKISGINSKIKLIPDSEKSKSLELAYSLIRDISKFAQKKKIFIIAFGGGVVGDLAGFIASIYKRGTAYIQIPTTLLAQVDSSIGGKTGVDLTEGKNLVGAFFQPKLVLTDIGLIRSLNQKQLSSGLAEVIKYGLISNKKLFAFLETKYKDILTKKQSALEFVIASSADIKAKIVSADEKEELGLRTTLNFGHTIGHAIETAGNYSKYTHGEAVALGMLVACDISKTLGLINDNILKKTEGLIKKYGLPVKIENLSLDKIIKSHYQDKKFIGSKNRFVLLERIGKTRVVENIPLKIITTAIKNRI